MGDLSIESYLRKNLKAGLNDFSIHCVELVVDGQDQSELTVAIVPGLIATDPKIGAITVEKFYIDGDVLTPKLAEEFPIDVVDEVR